LRADRVKCDSTADICPDLRVGSSNVFVESKAIGQSGQAILYANRVAKDRRFMREGNRIVYAFWRHRFAALKAATIEELWRGLGASVECVSLIDAATLATILRGREKRRINSRYMKSGVRNGYGSNGYGVGWAFPYSEVLSACSPTLFEASGLAVRNRGRRRSDLRDAAGVRGTVRIIPLAIFQTRDKTFDELRFPKP
jgi:hypothetical protein